MSADKWVRGSSFQVDEYLLLRSHLTVLEIAHQALKSRSFRRALEGNVGDEVELERAHTALDKYMNDLSED
jgi:hypothetical protein